MSEENDIFIEDNKSALLEEMAENINAIVEILQQVYIKNPDENARVDAAFLRNALMAISQSSGYISALFNQYIVLATGQVKEKCKPIGFDVFKKNE